MLDTYIINIVYVINIVYYISHVTSPQIRSRAPFQMQMLRRLNTMVSELAPPEIEPRASPPDDELPEDEPTEEEDELVER